MAPQDLEGETLGDKHRGYNRKLQQLATEKTYKDLDLKSDDTDINNLIKIDIASHNKNVDFILNALQSNDLYYVSKLLAKCTWLITDQGYASIINPNYLQSELFPKMTTKAITQLKKHIRHHIKDEKRAEMFYLDEKVKSESIKWLPYCSVPFIENNIKNHDINSYNNPMKPRLFKRLCEKSITIFEIIMKELNSYERARHLQIVTFLLNTDINKYLDIIENNDSRFGYLNLNHKATTLIMKHSPNRVIDKIENYVSLIHIPTFVKYLNVDEIKSFLYRQAKKDSKSLESSDLKKIFYYDNLKYFIKRLPKNEQFEFVKSSCMLRENENIIEENLAVSNGAMQLKKICNVCNQERYIWYLFAPFDIAFQEITKLISQNNDCYDKRELLSLLIKCADHNLQYIQSIVKYFINKHKNEDTSNKLRFITEILKQIRISKCDTATWNLLNELFKSMKVYETPSLLSSNEYVVNYIVIYNVINDQKTPELINKQFLFKTLKPFRTHMSKEQQNKVFDYLYEYLNSQLKKSVTDEKEFTECVQTVVQFLRLIKDWEKSLLDYPSILNKIKELANLKKKNSWKENLASLYNVNKAWRKHMFEESLTLCPNEEVCLNALKHEPQLLTRHGDEVEALRTDNTISLRRLLNKLRVYWPHSLAQQWINTYLNNIKETTSESVAVRSLCTVLPQTQLLDIIEKYKPKSPKIDWKQTDEHVLNIQRSLAKNMHRGRPQPTPDAILPYAVGDYLQFALPSLLAIFYNLKSTMNPHYIPKLLDAPVSVQKHGIRLAYEKLEREQLQNIFLNCWNTSKNLSIRAIIFKNTFALLCSEKDPINAASYWEFLKMFIDNLTFAEDKEIYKILSQVEEVPLNIRHLFLVRSYEFLQKLILNVKEVERSDYKRYCDILAPYSREVMENVDKGFVTAIINNFIKNEFFKSGEEVIAYIHHSGGTIGVISAYILYSENEENQIQKYKEILEPLMQQCFDKWVMQDKGDFYIRSRFQQLLTRLTYDLKDFVPKKKVMIPLKMYSLIQNKLEQSLSIQENYMMLTKWKLTVALAKLMEKLGCSSIEEDENIGFELGIICLEFLKKDIALYFPCIYKLFSKCLKSLLPDLLTKPATLKFYDAILSDQDFIHGYLCFIHIEEQNRKDEYEEIWKRVTSHPSVEIKMHYYSIIEEKDI